MNTETNSNPSAAEPPVPHVTPNAEPVKLLKLPGLIAISLYMILLAGAVVISVVLHHSELYFLVLPVLFVAAGLGLMMLQRWAWALTLAAVALSAGFFFWAYFTQPLAYGLLIQGLFNLLIFLYLVRTEVRKKLR